MKNLTYAMLVAALTAFVGGQATAEMPSAKSTVGMTTGQLVVATTGSSHELTPLTTHIKVPEGKELVLDLSLECGLLTRTLTKSKGGNKSTSVAEASVRINVLYKHEDEAEWHYAYPGGPGTGVVFCSRAQDLSATFQGIFQEGDPVEKWLVLEDNSGDGDEGLIVDTCDFSDDGVATNDDVCLAITVVGTCLIQGESGTVYLDLNCLTDEEIELVLDTMSANSFNFVAPNLTSGIYEVKVEADIDTCAGSSGRDDDGNCINEQPDNTDVEAKAYLGRGSLDIDERRFIQSETVLP